MKTLAWLTAGIGVGLAIYLVANAPGPQYATGSDNLEDAARNAAGWGTKQRATGLGSNLVGRVKEGLGNLTGNPDLANEGVGKFAQAAGQTLHDLNR